MIALFCLVAVLGVGNCMEQLPSRLEIESSINRTIDEVERMVEADPSLPRLSRSEIVDILFNITSRDMDSYKEHVDKTREDYQRALKVVLPYDSRDEAPKSDSTKSQSQGSTNSIDTKTKKSEDLASESANHYKNHRETYSEVSSEPPTRETLRQLLTNDRKQEGSPEKISFNLANFDSIKEASTHRPGSKNTMRNRGTPPRRENLQIVYSTSVTQKPITTKMIIHTTELNVQGFRPTMPPTRSTQNVLTSDQWRYNAPPATTTTKAPERPAPTTPKSSKLPATTKTTTTSTTTTERPQKPPAPTTTRSSKLHAATTTTGRPRRPLTKPTTKSAKPSPAVVRNHQNPSNYHFLPTMMTESTEKAASTTRISEVTKSQEIEFDMENLRILNADEKPAPFYVTPMSSTSSAKPQDPYTTANTPQVSKTMPPMREEVETLLASIGLRPQEEKVEEMTRSRVQQDEAATVTSHFQIPETNSVIREQPFDFEVASPSNRQPVFGTTPKDAVQGASNLSADIRSLFQRFGLQISNDKIARTTTTTARPLPTIGKSTVWNNFKPLPSSEIKDAGMKEFLAKFGLGTNANRNEKAMKERKVVDKPPSLIEAVPGNMRQILENIGLIRKPQKPATPRVIIATTEIPQLHVFKPHETSLDNERQRTKINVLLDTVKQVQEGKADVVAVQKAAKDLLETTKSLKNGPDPLSLEEILKMYNDDVKNEIKRQQDPKDVAEIAASATETSDTSSTTSTPDEALPSLDSASSSSDSSAASSDAGTSPIDSLSIDLLTIPKNTDGGGESETSEAPNLVGLAESFGGSTAAPDPVLPTRRKTGLYFLVDWNTFLEVGEEEKDKVNLRFQPKVGDRTRFLPVTIP